jgi:hypothetical protein
LGHRDKISNLFKISGQSSFNKDWEIEMTDRADFATHLDPALLGEIRAQAQREGQTIEFLIEEALQGLLGKRRAAEAFPVAHFPYQQAIRNFDALYGRYAR